MRHRERNRSPSSVTSESTRTRKRPQSFGRMTNVSVDTTRAKSNADVVRMALQALGWTDFPEKRTDGKNCDIYWHNVVYNDMRDVVPPGAKVNRFPGMNELSKKISLTRSLSSMERLFPDQYDFYPRSWFIPAQLNQFYEDFYSMLEERMGRIPWFIVKPDDGAQGANIYLIHTPEQLQNPETPQLIQEYVSEPYLMKDKLKFDFRVYALVKSLNPLSIYVAREGMARFCTQKYKAPSVANQDQAFMHLTNYSLNKTNADYVHSNTMEQQEQGSKRLLSTVFYQMEAHGVNTRKLWHHIKLIVVKTVLAMVPELMLHYENHFSTSTLQGPQCFHILGFDVMLKSDLRPVLLEVNACPSLSIGHNAVPGMPDDKENLPNKNSVVDEAIKYPLVRETLQLVMDQRTSSSGRERSGSAVSSSKSTVDDSEPPYHGKGSLREVFPANYGHSCGQLLVLDKAAYLFMQFVAVKRTLILTLSGVRMFTKKCNITEVISNGDLEVLFVKIQKTWTATKNNTSNVGLGFHGFVELVLYMAQRKYPDAANLLEAFNSLLNYCTAQLRHHGVRSARLRAETVEDEKMNSLKEIYMLPYRRNPSKAPVIGGNRKDNSQSLDRMSGGFRNKLHPDLISLPKI